MTLQIAKGYPQNIVQRPDDLGYEYDLRVYFPGAFSLSEFPAIGDTESLWSGIDSAKVLTRRFFVHEDCDALATYCDLHCGQDGESWVSAGEDGGLQKQLEFHESYLMKWNYHLCMKKGTTSYADFDTATTPALSEANMVKMKWVKEPSEAPIDATDGPWGIQSGYTKIKPGVETYISPSPVVREFKRFCKISDALDASLARTVGTVFRSTMNIYIPDQFWLVMASNYHFDGVYWITTVNYQSSSYWDFDLYGEDLDQPE